MLNFAAIHGAPPVPMSGLGSVLSPGRLVAPVRATGFLKEMDFQ